VGLGGIGASPGPLDGRPITTLTGCGAEFCEGTGTAIASGGSSGLHLTVGA